LALTAVQSGPPLVGGVVSGIGADY